MISNGRLIVFLYLLFLLFFSCSYLARIGREEVWGEYRFVSVSRHLLAEWTLDCRAPNEHVGAHTEGARLAYCVRALREDHRVHSHEGPPAHATRAVCVHS